MTLDQHGVLASFISLVSYLNSYALNLKKLKNLNFSVYIFPLFELCLCFALWPLSVDMGGARLMCNKCAQYS